MKQISIVFSIFAIASFIFWVYTQQKGEKLEKEKKEKIGAMVEEAKHIEKEAKACIAIQKTIKDICFDQQMEIVECIPFLLDNYEFRKNLKL